MVRGYHVSHACAGQTFRQTSTLSVTAFGLINPPELLAQPVEVWVNEQKIADWQVAAVAPFRATIPVELTKGGGTLTLTFKVPKAASPNSSG